MAFEPLHTDEKLDKPVKSGPDMDTQMLGGCSTFVAMSLLSYLLGAWPFFVIPSQFLLAQLLLASALGLGPISVFGLLFGMRVGLSAACGFFGGALTLAVFLYLHLSYIALGHTVPDFPRPDYPATLTWLIPTGWVFFAFAITVFSARIGEIRRDQIRSINR